jgi:DNA repair photolyase
MANPPNPWETNVVDYLGDAPLAPLQIFEDHSKSILSKNDSPDIGFTWSVNPYRGCLHGCSYCYARPTHEYLGFGSGTDFERKIVVKPRAAELLRQAFDRPSWKGELIVFSGNTDCYQPLEASYGITRACLEVCATYKNPVHIITKAPLIERDLDLLAGLARSASLGVTVSIPFWNEVHARSIEPYVATPARRMKTVRRLHEAGIRVSVNVAPIIPGLNKEDMPTILEEAKAAGAVSASMIIVRLPGTVKEVFEQTIRKELPLRADRILARTREVRAGKLNDPRFGHRHTGEGVYAETLSRLFERTAARLGLVGRRAQANEPCTTATFERPNPPLAARGAAQLDLFAGRAGVFSERPTTKKLNGDGPD